MFTVYLTGVEFHYPDEDRKKPDVPKKEDQPLMGLKTTKNFITTNAVQNITSVPKRPEKIYVDTKKGDKNYLEPSGMEPVYVHKKVSTCIQGSFYKVFTGYTSYNYISSVIRYHCACTSKTNQWVLNLQNNKVTFEATIKFVSTMNLYYISAS